MPDPPLHQTRRAPHQATSPSSPGLSSFRAANWMSQGLNSASAKQFSNGHVCPGSYPREPSRYCGCQIFGRQPWPLTCLSQAGGRQINRPRSSTKPKGMIREYLTGQKWSSWLNSSRLRSIQEPPSSTFVTFSRMQLRLAKVAGSGTQSLVRW